jgi:hypothetical protein
VGIKLISIKDLKIAARKQVDEIVDNLVENLKEATPVDTGYARSRWRREGDKIINDADYIEALNGGSSAQAPMYFIESTVLSQEGVRPNGEIVSRNDS